MKNIVYNNVNFVVDGNELKEMNHKKGTIDVLIPHRFPSGEVITTIPDDFCCYGKYNRITISNGISVIGDYAFSNSFVIEVLWPSSCESIPKGCFSESTIQKLLNIEHVTNIGDTAFFCSQLSSFSWPHKCAFVPKRCFGKSGLKVIKGLNVVQEIRELAFLNVSPSEPIDLSGCSSLAMSKNAFLGVDENMVIPPYYISRSDWDHAFNKRALEHMMPR